MNRIGNPHVARRILVAGLLSFLAATIAVAANAPIAISPRAGAPKDVAGTLESFWSQPPDINGSKISSELISELGLESEVANDFSYPTDTRVTRVRWWGGPYVWEEGDPELTTFNINFYDDSDCSPGSLIAWFDGVEVTPVLEEMDDAGQPVYRYEAPVSVPILGGETYWLVVQGDYHGNPPQWGRQQAIGTQGCGTMVRSTYFEYEEWTPASQIAEETWDASQELEINTPTLEACCDSWGFCELLMPDECVEQEGDPQGEGTECEPNPCPQPDYEACCLFGGMCYLMPREACIDSEGDPQGLDSVCDPNPCPQGEACCLFGGTCLMLEPGACEDYFGDPQGEGTTCDPNPCLGDLEACCFENGLCYLYTAENCDFVGGVSEGPDSVCDPNPCPQPDPRACCFEDGSCKVHTPIDCLESGGADEGLGSVCDPNPCPQPEPEACCFPDGSCQMLLEDECTVAEGASAGSGTTCDPNDCARIIPTEKTSWGWLKILYR